MTCALAEATVAREGAIVLTTGANTYARFVAHNGLCLPGQDTKPAVAPTLDNPNCPVGYTCAERESKH